jgi:predicted ATPase
MPEITAIRVKNFRVFKDLHTFSLKPITLLTGPNNSGKSSLIKLINLLKVCAENNQGLDVLNFDKLNELGSTDLVLNDPKKNLLIGFEAKLDYLNITLGIDFFYGANISGKQTNSQKLYLNGIQVTFKKQQLFYIECIESKIEEVGGEDHGDFYINGDFYFCTKYNFELDESCLLDFIADFKEAYDARISGLEASEEPRTVGESEFFGITDYFSEGYTYKNLSADLQYLSENIGSIDIVKSIEEKSPLNLSLPFSATNYSLISFLDRLSSTLKINSKIKDHSAIKTSIDSLLKLVLRPIQTFYKELKGIYHLSVANRKLDSRAIKYSDGFYGSLVSEYLNLYEDDKEAVNREVKKYLKTLDIGYDSIYIKEDPILQISTISIGTAKNDKEVVWRNLFDLGFGMSQMIAVFLRIAIPRYPKEDYDRLLGLSPIIILEEPETNLHPNLQSKLVDVLANTLKSSNFRFIIETHSPYLIRRFQFHRASKYLNQNDVGIFYFHLTDDSTARVKSIQITDNGLLDPNFGVGFLDEETEQKITLMRLKTKNLN